MPALTSSPVTPHSALDEIRRPVIGDLEAVNRAITEELFSDVPLIESVAKHIISGGGKRLRPLLVLLSARATQYSQGSEHQELAVVIELIHTATLLHDDVVDKTELRRGLETANGAFGNSASVLVGDFLYSRAFQILARRANVSVTRVLASATNTIAQGEVMQLMNQHDETLEKSHYLQVISRKTAELFQAAAQIGALLNPQTSTDYAERLKSYGHHLGMAYQIIDDMLDYSADPEVSGKALGNDLSEGKVTLPLLRTLQTCDAYTQSTIRQAIKKGAKEATQQQILQAVQKSDAHSYCHAEAKRYLDQALTAIAPLPESEYKRALKLLCQFVLDRQH